MIVSTSHMSSALGLDTNGGKFIAMSIAITWLTVLMLILTGVYPVSGGYPTLRVMAPLTLKSLVLYFILAFSSRCVRIGGCQKYYHLIVALSMSVCVYLVLSLP